MTGINRDILGERSAREGHIKIGGVGPTQKSRAGNDWRPPVKWDHIKITTGIRGDDGNFIVNEEVMEKLFANPANLQDGKVRKIRVFIPYDDPQKVIYNELSFYAGKSRLCHGTGNGETVDHKDAKSSVIKERKCPCHLYTDSEELKETNQPICKPYGVASFILYDDFKLGSVYNFTTTSKTSIRNILDTLEEMEKLTGGFINLGPERPYWLSLIPQPGKKGTTWVMKLTNDFSYDAIMNGARGMAKVYLAGQTMKKNRLALSAGDIQYDARADQTLDEQMHIQSEFYTDSDTKSSLENAVDDQAKTQSDQIKEQRRLMVEFAKEVWGDGYNKRLSRITAEHSPGYDKNTLLTAEQLESIMQEISAAAQADEKQEPKSKQEAVDFGEDDPPTSDYEDVVQF